jgi:methylated-DNA-protein-cysteine methyltransferase-like protein
LLFSLGDFVRHMSWQPVYRLVKKIPRGRVATYGDIAKTLRLRGGARAVGYAMASSPTGQAIPWHRVVGAGGRLLISEPHASLQRKLLASEGIPIEGRAIDMDRFRHSFSKRKSASRKSKRVKTR